MESYYLTCRSLTYAQKVSRALTAARIKNMIVRTTQSMSREGCGYAVRVSPEGLTSALAALAAASIPPKRVFLLHRGGIAEEVSF